MLDLTGPSLDESLVELPPYDQIARSGKRRRRRNRTTGVVAVALAVVMVGGGGALLADRPAARPATATAAQPWTFEQPADLLMQEPVSATEQYVMLKPASGQQVLAHTTDGGRSWEGWRVPDDNTVFANDNQPPPCKQAAEEMQCVVKRAASRFGMTVLGRDSVQVGFLITHDAGRSWRPVPVNDGATVAEVPPGWALVWDRGLIASDPETGERHPLATDLSRQLSRSAGGPVVVAPDGSYWLGHYGTQGEPPNVDCVSVSHDRGRSWRTTSWPKYGVTSVAGDGQTGYATLYDGRRKITLLTTTTDGGLTWTTPVPAKARSIEAVSAGGSLFVIEPGPDIRTAGPAAISHDGGKTFTPLTELGPATQVRRMDSGAYAIRLDGAPNKMRVAVSEDGHDFVVAPVPPNTRPYPY